MMSGAAEHREVCRSPCSPVVRFEEELIRVLAVLGVCMGLVVAGFLFLATSLHVNLWLRLALLSVALLCIAATIAVGVIVNDVRFTVGSLSSLMVTWPLFIWTSAWRRRRTFRSGVAGV